MQSFTVFQRDWRGSLHPIADISAPSAAEALAFFRVVDGLTSAVFVLPALSHEDTVFEVAGPLPESARD